MEVWSAARHPRPVTVVAVWTALVAALSFTVWHATVGHTHAPSVLALVAVAVEAIVTIRLAALAVRATWPARPRAAGFNGDARGSIIVLAAGHDPRVLRAAVLAARVASGVEHVVIVDTQDRAEVRRLCARLRVPLAENLDDALIAIGSKPAAIVDANHAVLPDIFCVTTPLLASGVAFVQGPVPDGDPLGAWRDRLVRPASAELGAAVFSGTSVVVDPVAFRDGGVVPDRRGGPLATSVALAGRGHRGVTVSQALTVPVRTPHDRAWRDEQARRSCAGTRVLWHSTNPLWARGLRPVARLLFLDEILDGYRGLGAVAAVAVVVASVTTGRFPVTPGTGAAVFALVALTTVAISHVLAARGQLEAGELAIDACASMGAHLRSALHPFGAAIAPRGVGPLRPDGAPPRSGAVQSFAAAALLTAVVARVAALRFHRGPPMVGPVASAVLAIGGLVAFAVLFAARRLSARLAWSIAPAPLRVVGGMGDDAVLIALDQDQLEVEAGAVPEGPARLDAELALSSGTRALTLTVQPAWRRQQKSGRWRFAGPYSVTPPAAADDLAVISVVTAPFERLRERAARGAEPAASRPPARGGSHDGSRGAAWPVRSLAACGLLAVAVVGSWPHHSAPVVRAPQVIAGTVFHDARALGRRQVDITFTEPGIAGVSVRGVDDNATIVATATTDADGHYRLLLPGRTSRVQVVFLPPRGYALGPFGPDSRGTVRIGSAGDDHVDVGFTRPGDFCVSVPNSTTSVSDTASAGAASPPSGASGAGQASPSGTAGPVAQAATSGPTTSGARSSAPTSSSRSPTATPASSSPTPPVTGPSGPSAQPATSSSQTTAVSTGTGEGGVTVTCRPGPVGLGGRLWRDADGDGVAQPSEPALAGVSVQLWRGSVLVGTAVSGADGAYAFSSVSVAPATGDSSDVGGGVQAGQAFEVRVPGLGGLSPQAAMRGLVPSRIAATNAKDPVVNVGVLRGSDAVAAVTAGAPATTDLTVDFGFTTAMSLGGRVVDDTDGTGVLTAAKPGLPGMKVALVPDPTSSGAPTAPPVAATTTGADGRYLFTGVTPGTYDVEVTGLPPGYFSSIGAPAASGPYEGPLTPSPASAIAGVDHGTTVSAPGAPIVVRSKPVTLTPGAVPLGGPDPGGADPAPASSSDQTLDFGFFHAALIGGRVWHDANRTGVVDPSPGAATDGVMVSLLAPDGRVLATAVTGDTKAGFASGTYNFLYVPPGDYQVQFGSLPPGAVLSAPGQGHDPNQASKADPTTGRTAVFHVGPGQFAVNLNAGWSGAELGVGGRVWNDLNANGILDASEPGLDNVAVRLFASDGVTKVAPDQTTSSGGYYLFTGLPPGDYIVEVQPPSSDWRVPDPVAPSAGQITNRGLATSPLPGAPARTVPVRLAAGGAPSRGGALAGHPLPKGVAAANVDSTVAFALYQPNGLTVAAGIDPATAGWPAAPATGQDVLVQFIATNTGPGAAKAGWTLTAHFPASLPPAAVASAPADLACSISRADLRCTSSSAASPGLREAVSVRATLSAGTTPGDSADLEVSAQIAPAPGDVPNQRPLGDPTSGLVDRVVVPTATTGIGGVVWEDRTHDGVRQPAEPGLAGISVHIFDANGAEVPVGRNGVAGSGSGGVLTAADGRYHITSLQPGTYTIQFSSVPPLLVGTIPGQGGDPTRSSTPDPVTLRTPPIALAAGTDNIGVNLGVHHVGGSVAATVWQDLARDGRLDTGDPGMAGVVVALRHGDGTPVLAGGEPLTTTTDSAGRYHFDDVNPGSYRVAFGLPGAFQRSARTDASGGVVGSSADPITGVSPAFDVPDSGQVSSAGAGYVTPAAQVSGAVWADASGGGVRRSDSQPVTGVKVELISAAAGSVVASGSTSPDGTYQFASVAPGAYRLHFDSSSLPAGTHLTRPGAAVTMDNASAPLPADGLTVAFTVLAGQSVASWNAGAVRSAAVGGVVWRDDGTGIHRGADPGIGGVGVTLADAASGATVNRTVTDSTGAYRFDGVLPGTYTVTLTAIPVGSRLSALGAAAQGLSGADLAHAHSAPFVVQAGGDRGDLGAGVVMPSGVVGGDVSIVEPSRVDTQPLGIAAAGLTVTVVDERDRVLATTVVDGSGRFALGGLPAGRYRLLFAIPPGVEVTRTSTSGGTIDRQGRTNLFELASGMHDLSHHVSLLKTPPPADLTQLAQREHRQRLAHRERNAAIVVDCVALSIAVLIVGSRLRRPRQTQPAA